jgi:hypothetical protein
MGTDLKISVFTGRIIMDIELSKIQTLFVYDLIVDAVNSDELYVKALQSTKEILKEPTIQ